MSVPPIALDPIAVAQALMRCASVTPQDAGALGVVESFLKPLGFMCERVRFEEAGTEPVENIFAKIGSGSPHFCFAGHVDVVPVGDRAAWSVDPFAAEVKDGFLYGRGAEDMKGAIAAFIAAAAAHIAAQPQNAGSISLLLTGDEEGVAINGTRKMLDWLRARGEVIEMCLVGEPTSVERTGDMVKIGRRGSMTCTLTVNGKQGHVAYPHLADNPITPLIAILHRLKEAPLDAGTEFFPASNLEITTVDVGNPAVNVIPARAVAKFNIRFNSLHSSEALKDWLHGHCRAVAGDKYTLEARVTGEAFFTPPGKMSTLVSDAIFAETGFRPELSTTGGTSDARFIKDFCPVIEFGLTGKTAHMVDERVLVDDVHRLTRIYQRVLAQFFA